MYITCGYLIIPRAVLQVFKKNSHAASSLMPPTTKKMILNVGYSHPANVGSPRQDGFSLSLAVCVRKSKSSSSPAARVVN